MTISTTPIESTKQKIGESCEAECRQENASHLLQGVGGKGHPARLCQPTDDCQDVDEVGTEPSSDADSNLFGVDWG